MNMIPQTNPDEKTLSDALNFFLKCKSKIQFSISEVEFSLIEEVRNGN